MSLLLIGLLVGSLLFASFLALADYSYQAANKLQLELESRLGSRTGRILGIFAKRQLWVLGTTLVGVTVSLVVFTATLCILTTPLFSVTTHAGRLGVFALQSLMAAILLVLAVVVAPRMMRIFDPNVILSRIAVPFFICFILCLPLTWPFLMVSRYINVRLLGSRHDETKPFLGTPASPLIASSSEDPSPFFDSKIVHNALAFKTVKIRDCMVPRTEITAIELNAPIEKLRETFIESGHSKVLVYKQDLDDIVGFCHSSSMFRKPQEIREVLTPIIISAENNSANDLMIRFIREKKNLAVVIDEFGGTSGVVSMEDIIEEIFGKVDDEHDMADDLVEQRIGPDTYLLSARLEVDHLNESYGWHLPAGEYETLGGLILAHTDDFPRAGQVVEIPPFTFTIRAIGRNRIEQVVVIVGGMAQG
ncbi:hemolysin family protein [Chryseolinea sp. T2]|uniref:hemolysin family protein n=1 Tax=Chryseolinea sp. T2 TaxID=3129255 RepID=UPI003077F7BB